MTTYNRHRLADAVAMARVEYEDDTLAKGYTAAAFQPLVPFAIDVVKGLLRAGHRIHGCTYTRRPDAPRFDGGTFTLNVDWPKLAKTVERRLPRWRETMHQDAK